MKESSTFGLNLVCKLQECFIKTAFIYSSPYTGLTSEHTFCLQIRVPKIRNLSSFPMSLEVKQD